VRDDVGNAVDLHHVEGDAIAGKLVGEWVAVTGRAITTAAGRLVALDDAKVETVVDPGAALMDRSVAPIEMILASAPGPGPDGGIDLTDEEFAEFLKAARS
jgi:hypothetical protein